MSGSIDLSAALERAQVRLPRVGEPLGNYIYASEYSGLLFVSGQTPTEGGHPVVRGRLGEEVSLEQGRQAARLTLLNVLAIVDDHLGGLHRVAKVLRLTGYVAASEQFTEHPAVLNGASDFLTEVWGSRGKHARLAVGVNSLPQGAPIEIEAVMALEPVITG